MSAPILLDLYCCEGGAARGYQRAGFTVMGVDLQERFAAQYAGDGFLAMSALDALDALLTGGALVFDLRAGGYQTVYARDLTAVHASPPCQAHTTLTKGHLARGVDNGHVDLIEPTRPRLEQLDLPYVIENVTSAPVRPDVTLCGLMFGLRVFRHRLFELGGWKAEQPEHPTHRGHRVAGWRHGVRYEGDMFAVYGNGGGKGTVAEWQEAMGIDWTEGRLALAEAIPPAYTEHLGRQLMAHVVGAP